MGTNAGDDRWGVSFDEIGPVGCGAWVSFADVAGARPASADQTSKRPAPARTERLKTSRA